MLVGSRGRPSKNPSGRGKVMEGFGFSIFCGGARPRAAPFPAEWITSLWGPAIDDYRSLESRTSRPPFPPCLQDSSSRVIFYSRFHQLRCCCPLLIGWFLRAGNLTECDTIRYRGSILQTRVIAAPSRHIPPAQGIHLHRKPTKLSSPIRIPDSLGPLKSGL